MFCRKITQVIQKVFGKMHKCCPSSITFNQKMSRIFVMNVLIRMYRMKKRVFLIRKSGLGGLFLILILLTETILLIFHISVYGAFGISDYVRKIGLLGHFERFTQVHYLWSRRSSLWKLPSSFKCPKGLRLLLMVLY